VNRALAALLLVAMIACGTAHANAPTGYDVLTINDREFDQVHYLAGCTMYIFPGQIVAYCGWQETETPALPERVSSTPVIFGAIATDFEWWPERAACTLVADDDMGTYTAYAVECIQQIFRDGFEAP
jgi:hypothetical protein